MSAEILSDSLVFLAGGGEMGRLTRAKNWSATPVGDPACWPQSLRTTLSIILNSRFPMFLWWGPELTCFYNDAYRPSLGENGKHPSILGQPAKEAWAEIWTIIGPLIDQVMTGGGSTWSEDQLIPIYRNGGIEDVYWTFSYSPVNDESGTAGVLVTCHETTEKVKMLQALAERGEQLSFTLNAAELSTWDLNPATNKFIGNDRIKEWFGLPPEADIELSLALNAIVEADRQRVTDAIATALQPASGGHYDIEYTIKNPENGRERTVVAKGKALFDENNVAYRFSGTLQDITERVQATQQLAENEKKQKVIIHASGLGHFDLNFQTDEIVFSDRLTEIFGYKGRGDFDHAQFVKQLHPEDMAIRDKAVKEAIDTGALCYAVRIVWSDGSVHWIEARGKVFYDKENKPVRLIGTIRDLTDEKTHQQELQESEQKFRLLADSMPQFIWTGDVAGNLHYFNQSVFNYSGLTAEQIYSGNGWLQIVHPDDREQNIKKWQEAVTTGADFLFEHRFRRHDGVYHWQLSRATPQKDADGNIQMWVGTSTDIEEQKLFASELEKQVNERTKQLNESQDELIKSEERYHLMVDEVQDYAILFINREGIIENWNKGAQRIKGYTAEEIIGKSFSVFYTDEDRQDNLPGRLLNQALTTGKATQEGWRVRKDGTLFWASVVITALHNSQNQTIGFSKVTRDLTEKKEAENKIMAHAAQMEQKNNELVKINTELQSFAYISSHDLQEPLRKIQTFASRIIDIENDNLSLKGKDYFKRMQEAANRMQTLIQDLLAYSRTNSSDRIFTNTALKEIVDEVKNDLKEAMAEKDAVFEVGEMCKASIIVFQFRQLIYNLVGNALKFSRPGVAPVIKISSEPIKGDKLKIAGIVPQKSYCHISVSDNGIGFNPQYKERIFEVFQRLHGKDEYMGTGIGLAIVKKIVENHNGFITASGQPNKGATFDIYIPTK